jgi:hypothetical protein
MATALLSNGLVKNLNNRETVFYGVLAATVVMQWFGKRVSTIEAMFSARSVQRSYLKKKNATIQSVLTSAFCVLGGK